MTDISFGVIVQNIIGCAEPSELDGLVQASRKVIQQFDPFFSSHVDPTFRFWD